MTAVIVYSKPPEMGVCQMCEATKRKLKKLGVPFVDEDLYDPLNAGILARAQSEGITALPVVHVLDDERDEMFGGYNPVRLGELAVQ